MADLESFQGDFKGWTIDQRKKFLADAIECFRQHIYLGFGAAVIVEQYRAWPTEIGEALIDPWFMCFQMAVSQAARALFSTVAGKDDLTAPVSFVFDQQSEFGGRAVDSFRWMHENADHGRRLGSLTLGSTEMFPPLQPADLVAFEVRKAIEHALYEPTRNVRWPMQQLQKMMFTGMYFDVAGQVPNLPAGEFTSWHRVTFGEFRGAPALISWPVDRRR